jgi:hypothetical protein
VQQITKIDLVTPMTLGLTIPETLLQLPAINGDRNTQLVAEPKQCWAHCTG